MTREEILIAVKNRANLQGANLQYADLRNADLQGANLRNANLRNANLQGANIDFSCLPLWCGSVGMIVDKKIAMQIAAHFCALVCDDPEYREAKANIIDFAKKSHRTEEIFSEEGKQ